MSISDRLREIEEQLEDLKGQNQFNWINEQLTAIRDFIGMEHPSDISDISDIQDEEEWEDPGDNNTFEDENDEDEEQLYHIRISSKDSVMYLAENEDDPLHFEWNRHPSNSSKFCLLEGEELLRKNQFPARGKSYGKPMLESI